MPPPNKIINLSDFQKEVLDGLMLGDGHLSLYKNANANLIVGRSIKDIEYLKYEANIFYNFLTPMFQKCLVKETSYFSKKLNKISNQCFFRTSNNQSLTEIYNRWYPNKIKEVPKDLKLTPVVMAHWIADDGCLQFPKLPYRFQLDLSTDGFCKLDVERLINLLSIKYDETINLKSSKYYTIRIYDNATRKIIKDIDPYFKMSRKRYWDNSETRYYSNTPERQFEKNKSIDKKSFILEELLSNKTEISLEELFHTLGYKGKVSAKKMQYIFKKYKNNLIKIISPGQPTKILFKK